MYEDLGTENAPLLPSSETWHDPRVRPGTAEWVPFEAPKEGDAAKNSEGQPPTGGADAEQTATDIRTLVGDHNALVRNGEYDKAVEYYVKEQRAAAKELFEVSQRGVEIFESVRAAVVEKLPDAKDRTDKVIDRLVDRTRAQIHLKSLEVVSDTEAKGTLPAAPGYPAGAKFSLQRDEEQDEDYWFIALDTLADWTKNKAGIETGITQIEGLATAAKNGVMPPEQILTSLEAMANMIDAAMGEAPAKESAPSGDVEDK